MSRTTIDFGIDLGTTNSRVAVLERGEVEVIRNHENSEYTPSAVWIDRHGVLFTGRPAYEQLARDSANAYAEFKLQMGATSVVTFASSGRQLRPEELSAAILKSLKADVRRARGEDIEAAVITVPAAFELPQCEATKVAAQLAGIIHCPLLQEPVAAAMTYSFQGKTDRAFWLVYDLGGGTFDAAVISIRDDIIQVINLGGDNHLGGKLIDWEIVDELLAPAIAKEHRLANFRRGNPKWRSAFAKLKSEAERAKIRLSSVEQSPIHIGYLCADDSGEPVELDFVLRRADVERIMDAFILRSVNICRRVLADKRLSPANVEKILLVGGPTLAPYLRERLADPKEGLGITLDFSLDPMTVVAQGAAIFAGTQRVAPSFTPAVSGEYRMELEFPPVGSGREFVVRGRVLPAAGGPVSGFTVEFTNDSASPPWQSGKIGLSANGNFVSTLLADPCGSVFRIELCDQSGRVQRCKPEQIHYRVGRVIASVPLVHSIGVALANNELFPFLEKGTELPARKRHTLRTTLSVRRGESLDLIRIPVVEGDNHKRADRNRLIGAVVVTASNVKRDVPAGTEIEFLIEIDASRLITTKAFIPLLDEEEEQVLSLKIDHPGTEELRSGFDRERERLSRILKQARPIGDATVHSILQRFEGERMVQEVESALSAAEDDPDAADKCAKRLLELRQAADEIEDAIEWPCLVADAERAVEDARRVTEEYSQGANAEALAEASRQVERFIQLRDPDSLRLTLDKLAELRYQAMSEQPSFWISLFEHLKSQLRTRIEEQPLREELLSAGQHAIQSSDIDALKLIVSRCMALLPEEHRPGARGFGSTVDRV